MATAQRRLDALSLASFVALGLPDGMLGTAWPAMRATLHAPVGDLGFILLGATAGSVLITAFVGRLIRRAGVAALLVAGMACAAVAAAGFALAPAFGVILGIAVLFGLAAGSTDGALNTAIGLSGRRRLINLLHGAYGVGTAIGPLVVTAAIVTSSWRAAYLVLLLADCGMAVLWALQRRASALGPAGTGSGAADNFPSAATAAGDGAPSAMSARGDGQPDAAASDQALRAAVIAGIVVFFLYAGLEVAAGQWETSFARGHLHLGASEAGLATFGYWAALTAVRLTLGLLPRAPSHQSVVRWGSGLAVLACALIWWQPGTAATIAGFVVLGGALAGVFPALIALTPARLGTERAQHAIAWQVGASAAGAAGVSAVIGILIGTSGLGVLGPALAVLALLLVASEMALGKLAPLNKARDGREGNIVAR